MTFSERDGVTVDFAKLKKESGISEEEWDDLLAYTAQVHSNLTNYRCASSDAARLHAEHRAERCGRAIHL